MFREEIVSLLTRMNLRFKVYPHGIRIANPALHRFCVSEIEKGARNKKIPSVILNSSIYVKRRLMDALYKGDGNRRNPRYTTVSPLLADQACTLLAQLGLSSEKILRREGSNLQNLLV